MSSCEFLPAWLSRITWSTFDSSNCGSRLRTRVGRADEPGAAVRRLALRRLLPGQVLLPQVHGARLDRAVRVVEDQRELEERPALGAALRLLVGVGEHMNPDTTAMFGFVW